MMNEQIESQGKKTTNSILINDMDLQTAKANYVKKFELVLAELNNARDNFTRISLQNSIHQDEIKALKVELNQVKRSYQLLQDENERLQTIEEQYHETMQESNDLKKQFYEVLNASKLDSFINEIHNNSEH